MSVRDDLLVQFGNKVTSAIEHYVDMCNLAELEGMDALGALAGVVAHIASILMVPVELGDDSIDKLSEMFKKKLVEANDERRRAEGV